MAQNYHLILLEGFTPWSNMVEKLQSGGRQIPFCKYVFLGRTIQMLWGGGGGGNRVGMFPIALKSSPKSGQNMAKKVLK